MAQRLIDASGLPDKMCDVCNGCPPDGDQPCRFIKLILNTPTVSPKRPTGQLIKTGTELVCSKCGTVHRGTVATIKYCMHCGVKFTKLVERIVPKPVSETDVLVEGFLTVYKDKKYTFSDIFEFCVGKGCENPYSASEAVSVILYRRNHNKPNF